MAFILTKASDIRIATESAIWEWLLKLQRGNAQDMKHSVQSFKALQSSRQFWSSRLSVVPQN
ncbi:hypothetical protein F7725_023283 [Dissostichus mawsoni]|uniref:Uncharacterized protein n=1 Tax=Dissostichus mawsoni TaxID=36200 RepID=A0A7J5Z4I9_DISMA|nr:hypothetical protein F7725_023283 [Dissostichus mawsoni]